MRRSHITLCAAVFAVFASSAFAANCAQPGPAPVIPDGTTATVDQMKAAHQAVQTYVNSLQSVQDCNEAKIKMGQKTIKPDDLQKMRDAGNAAVDQAQALAAAYMAQKKIYNNRAPGTVPPAAPK